MRGFIQIHRADTAIPVYLGVGQIVSIEIIALHKRQPRAHLRMSNGEQFDTAESYEDVLDLIEEADLPADIDAPADPAPTGAAPQQVEVKKRRGRPPNPPKAT